MPDKNVGDAARYFQSEGGLSRLKKAEFWPVEL
jgi:hypothetical protein